MLAAACADPPEAPPSLADQLSDQHGAGEMLPVFTEMIDLLATADDDELDAFAMQAWPRLSGFVADLASLGFRHCFQEQALIP